jgi:hypothetical protein
MSASIPDYSPIIGAISVHNLEPVVCQESAAIEPQKLLVVNYEGQG